MVRVSLNYDNLAYVGAVRRFGNNFEVTIYGIASIFKNVLRFLAVSSTFQKLLNVVPMISIVSAPHQPRTASAASGMSECIRLLYIIP
jgi:hypothetical protein